MKLTMLEYIFTSWRIIEIQTYALQFVSFVEYPELLFYSIFFNTWLWVRQQNVLWMFNFFEEKYLSVVYRFAPVMFKNFLGHNFFVDLKK
jgi:hypothetical protein